MNSIRVSYRSIGGYLAFDSGVGVELSFRAALAGTVKDVVVGLRLVKGEDTSQMVCFEPRISALEICTNYKKAQRRKGISPNVWAAKFVESLVSPEIDSKPETSNASSLEKLTAEHFASEKVFVNFEPYSLSEDTKVDVFINYRRKCLSLSVDMSMLLPFVKAECFCADARAERYCVLCDK